jgi:hypothetical protein
MKLILGIALAVGLLALSWFAFRRLSTEQVPHASDLLGTWTLKTVAGKPPETIAAKSWKLEFRDRQCHYAGEMMGKYGGIKVSGDGTWSLHGRRLEYRAGSTTGISTASIDHDVLRLNPDPVLRLHGKEVVASEYIRF